MSENAKRLLTYFMVVCMLFSMLPVGVVAQGQTVEPGETEPVVEQLNTEPETGSESTPPEEPDVDTLELGVAKEATFLNGQEHMDFLFVPAESGVYSFTTISTWDTFGTLFEVLEYEKPELAGDHNSGDAENFLISQQLVAGHTYQLRVHNFYGGEPSFQVLVERSLLQSITFTSITVMEDTCGNITTQWNPETETPDLEYFRYDPWQLLQKSTYTATFDGTTQSGSGTGFTYNGEYYSFSYNADQSYTNQWTVGNTYYIDVSVMGHSVRIPVTIIPSPLQSISFTPITVMEGTCGSISTDWNPETQTSDLEYFRYDPWQLLQKSTYTATFDGTTQSGNGSGFNYDGQYYSFSYSSDQSYTNQWTVGNTYYIDVSVMGHSVQVPVTITASPLQSISFTPITVIEGTCGSISTQWNPETQTNDLKYFQYNPWDLLQKSTYTATFDGTTQSGSGTSFYYNGERYSFSYNADQSYTNQWTVGNTYYIDVSVMGQNVQVPVTIVPSPVTSLTVAPITLIEGKNGYDNGTYYNYNWQQKLSYTVIFEDGTSISRDYGNGFDYNGEWCSVTTSDNQSQNNPWTAGNTYTATASVMGVSAQVPVTIAETPVKAVTINPIIIEEYKNGYWSWWDWENDLKYFDYNWLPLITYTIEFKDGTVLQGGNNTPVIYNGEYYSISSTSGDTQSYGNPWLAGNTYAVQVSLDGKWYETYVSIHRSTEDNGYKYIVQDDKAIITGCTTTGEILDIPETIDGYPVVGITSLGEAIYYALEIRIPDSVTMLSANAFANAMSLKKLVLGSGISTLGINMLEKAFSLEWIEISKENPYLCSIDGVVYDKDVTRLIYFPTAKNELHKIPDSVTDVDILFNNGSWAETFANANIQLGAGVTKYKMVDGIIYNEDMTEVLFCTASATGSYVMPESVTDIAEFAFIDSNLTSVTISPNVTTIVYSAFYCSAKLQEVTLPESVTGIHHSAFYGCESLEKVHIKDIVQWCAIRDAGAALLSYAHNLYIDGELVKDLVIPENVVTTIYWATFSGGSFETVTIPSSVKQIEYDAFANCENLEKVYITDLTAWCNTSFGNGESNPLRYAKNLYLNGELITDLEIPSDVDRIREHAFYGGSFESVTIPAGVTLIGYEAFGGCTELKKVYITDLSAWCNINFGEDTSNPLYYANNLYLNGELITDLEIPSNVSEIKKYAFYNGNIRTATVPATVYNIGYCAFYNSSIEEISIAEGLRAINQCAFQQSALTGVELPDSLAYLGDGAFFECAALESVDIGSGLTVIESNTFYKTGLKSVTIPKQVTDIYSNAFASSALTQVQFDCDAVSLHGSVFRNCPLGDLELGDNIKQIGAYDFENIQATQIKLPPSVTYLTYRTFAFNTNLVSVTIPDTMEHIETSAFEGDRNLSHVLYTGTQDQWTALNVQSPELNQATLHCEAVGNEVTTEQTCANIRFFCTICDKWETVKKLNASHTFVDGVCSVCGQEGCWEYVVDEEAGEVTITGYEGTESDVVIPDELEGLPVTTFTAGTFAYNNKLTAVTIPGTVKEVPSEAFRNCKSLVRVTVESGTTTIGNYAFYDCWSLYTVELPDTVTTIGEYAFYENSLGNFQIPQSVKTIEEAAFFGCGGLREVVIPEGVTEICYNTFCGCFTEELQLPETLVTIGENAFTDHHLTELEIPASVETIGTGAFKSSNTYEPLETVIFQGTKPAMDDVFNGSFTAFYEFGLAGWAEYVASYEGNIMWYASKAPEILAQPENVIVESGNIATVSAEAYGHRLSYQWYYAPYGSNVFTAVGGNSIELSMVMDANNPNCRAYCVITDVLGRTTTTETVTLKINAEPTGIRINRLPYTLEYSLRQALRTDGLEVVMTYSDLTEAPIENYKISGYDSNVGGEQVVTVSFGSYSAYFSVAVNEEKMNFADKQEGVEISAPKDALDDDTVLHVETVEIEDSVQEVPEFFEDKVTVSFDITLQKDEQVVQPREEVKVSIPVPENMRGRRCRIYHIDAHGNIEDMNALLIGAFLEFYTNHFSVYSIVELPGYTVSGNIASSASTQNVTVKLIRDGNIIQSVQTNKGTYSFDEVVDGNYTLEVNAEGGNVRSYAITVEGAAVYQNLSVVEHTVTFLDWDESVIASEKYFEGSLVTAPTDPTRKNDRTYSYTFTGWDKKIAPCTEDAVYMATYSRSVLNDGGSITVGSALVGLGEQFVLPVSVSGNLGISGLKHTLTFDATVFKLISVEFQGDFAQGTPIINTEKANDGLLTVLWFSDHEVTSDGVMYNLTFEVLETATDKKAEIAIAFNEDGNANNAGENVIFEAVCGVVQVRTYWLGDLNGDRECKMVDLIMLAQYVAEFEMELTERQLLAADVNEDGDINIHDVILLNQWLLEQDK